VSAPAVTELRAAVGSRGLERLRAAVATAAAAVMGAAPHVLHHAGPLAGAALLAGLTGKLLFGLLGFVVAIPMLRRLRRRTGSWRVPGGALAVMAVVFAFSSFVIGPALTGDEQAAPANNVPAAPAGVSPAEHESHHR
jgi:hypothetical protein